MLLNTLKTHRPFQKGCGTQNPFLFLLFILPLVACPMLGQEVAKKKLSVEDYSRFGEMTLQMYSPDEQWAGFTMEYSSGIETLFIRNIKSGKTFSFQGGNNGQFILKDRFVCQTDKGLQITSLGSSKTELIPDVRQYFYSTANSLLVSLKSRKNQKNEIEIRSLKTGKNSIINNVSDFYPSPDGQFLAYTVSDSGRHSAALIDLKDPWNVTWLAKESAGRLVSFAWQKEARALAFIRQTENPQENSLIYYISKGKKRFELNPLKDSAFPKNWLITIDPSRKILISDDLQKVFFTARENNVAKAENKNTSDVEIWNANDKWILAKEKNMGSIEKKSKLALWKPLEQKTDIITSNELPSIMLTGDQKYAVLSNPKAYEPQFEYEGPRDYYAVNLSTMEKKIMLQKQPSDPEALNPSPGGKYIAYFKEDSWWIYDPKSDSHRDITHALPSKFNGKKQELVPLSVYGNPGWTANDNEIILYDQYDIWAVKPDGSDARCLTKGREKCISFRIAQTNRNSLKMVYDGTASEVIDLDHDLFLRAKGPDGKTGCFKWTKKSSEKELFYSHSYLDQFKYNKEGGSVIFREQNFDMPPRVMGAGRTSEPVFIFQSNPQQKEYSWGRSELVGFQNSKGENLKAVLTYPADYDPSKKYPMIVNIYEKKSDELHIYQNPELENGGGFNASILAQEGYFVLQPDINLEYQNTGLGAVDCVVSAVRNIIAKGIINPARVGLMGHSFGGYETAFIVTQTPMFAAAVAGGAITDLNSFYYSVGRSGNPNMWRFEKELWNMGGPPNELVLAYQANSPIVHAEKIQNPLLIWTGKADAQVNYSQSLELYLALRRFKKKSILLVYPEEDHVLMKPENQKDITLRILDWFAYFLKDNRSAKWITEGTR